MIFLKYGHFSYDRVNDQHMFTKQMFIAYCCNFISPPEAASKQQQAAVAYGCHSPAWLFLV
jgi:hypothetical protein